jgi:hypothetical protein
MRKSVILICLAAAGLLRAQEGRTWVDLQGGSVRQKESWTRGQASRMFQDSSGFGCGLGTWVTDAWAVELSALFSQVQLLNSDAKAHEAHGFLSVLYNLHPNYVWAPYLTAGAGATRLDPKLGGTVAWSVVPSYYGGAGFQFYPFERLQFGLEARMVRIQAEPKAGGFRREEGQLLISIGYRWRR